jgi:hypothetical protein
MADEADAAEGRRRTARTLGRLVEPIAAHAYFSKPAWKRYEDLGLDWFQGYFCSRSACMGVLSGQAVAATFGVFNPDIVVPFVEGGWAVDGAERDAVLEARLEGTRESLTELLGGPEPDGIERATELLRQAGEGTAPGGRAIHAGLRSLGWPGDPMGDLWRAADLIREHRGDGHNAVWTTSEVDAVEISILFELWRGLPLRSYSPTRGWTDAELDPAVARLEQRGLIDGDQLTDEGSAVREAIEVATDDGERRVVAALGDDAEELFALLRPWATSIVEQGGYPGSPDDLTRDRS